MIDTVMPTDTIKSMKTCILTFALGAALAFTTSGALFASDLPACPKDEAAVWNDCFGSFHKADGEKYVGEFKNDMRHGYGTVSFVAPHANAGNKYVGEIYKGKANGSGTYFVSNGDKYVGEWKDSQRQGLGTYTFANGDEYVGEWKAHQMHGEGIYIYADGSVEEGVWENNEFQHAKKLSQSNPQTTLASENNGSNFRDEFSKAHSQQDYATALRMIKPHAESGNPQAQFWLAQYYSQGFGVKKDLVIAAELYRKAGNQNWHPAVFNLGVLYHTEARKLGSARLFLEAAKQFRKILEGDGIDDFGYLAAQMIGSDYIDGNGVIKDLVYAHMWTNIGESLPGYI